MKDLADVLANWRGDAAVLRARGHEHDAGLIETLCTEVAEAAEEWLLWLSESDAAIRAGRSETWLRGRYPELEREGHARTKGRARQYRACAVPRRANAVAAAERAKEIARQERKLA